MSVAEADLLHALAHRAANDARDVDDWWGNSLNTALAAVTRARHSSGYQGDAERALDRLLRWWKDEKPRRISRDVTAMALGARAAADLQRSDPHLVVEAAQAVDDLARRDPTAAPIFTYGEAEALFGERAATATLDLEQAQDRHQRVAGLLVALVGLALGLATWASLLDLHWNGAVAASLAVTVASCVLAVAALLGRAGGEPEKLMEALGSLFVTAAIVGALDALNKHVAHPLISDINGLIVGALLTIVVFAIWQGGRRLFRSRPERSTRS